MAGDEERRARGALDEMQVRISQGPYAALGIHAAASPEDVRAAFLALTKVFHPARFGRMSTELQRLSNEVFLGIKSAHDQLQKALGGMGRVSNAAQSGNIPTIAGEGSGRTPAPQLIRRTAQLPPFERAGIPDRPPTGQIPIQRPPTGQIPVQQRPATGQQPAVERRGHVGTEPPATQPHSQQFARGTDRPVQPMQRPSAPVISTQPGARPATPNPAPGQRPSSPAIGARPTTPSPGPKTPPLGIPIQRPTTPVTARPGTPPLRPTTPAGRASTPSTPPPNAPPRPSSDVTPGTQRGVQPASASASQSMPRMGPAFDERSALRECMMLLNDRKWADARQALHTLASKVPQSKSYRALLSYARAREAQVAGRIDEAQLEIQRALQLDPELDLAKQALAELSRRR